MHNESKLKGKSNRKKNENVEQSMSKYYHFIYYFICIYQNNTNYVIKIIITKLNFCFLVEWIELDF